MDFKNASELLALCAQQQLPISEIMRRRECELGESTRDEVTHRMTHALEIMRASAMTPLKTPVKSMGGLIGGEAKKLAQHDAKGRSICGNVLHKAAQYAMAVLEVNASMGLIVAAPTAGSAGVLPGMLFALQDCYRISDERLIDALFNAGAIGYLAMRNATVAGAVGGCQAEIGVASAMAASAAVELMGGSRAVSRRGVHRADEYARSGLRPGRRSGRVPVPEPQRGGRGERPRCRRAVARRHPPVHPIRRDARHDVCRRPPHSARAARDRPRRLCHHPVRLRKVRTVRVKPLRKQFNAI